MLQQSETQQIWNSLEITKLIVSALTPVILGFVGWWLNRQLKKFESIQWANQKAIEKRLSIYSDLAPILNDIYCYFDYIGNWMALSPVDVIELKRKADRLFFVNAPLFPKEFRTEYQKFINLCFKPGPEEDIEKSAQLKTDVDKRKKHFSKQVDAKLVNWGPGWDILFAPNEDIIERTTIRNGYWNMMNVFAKQLGVGLQKSA
jgi:hypothetical protein